MININLRRNKEIILGIVLIVAALLVRMLLDQSIIVITFVNPKKVHVADTIKYSLLIIANKNTEIQIPEVEENLNKLEVKDIQESLTLFLNL